MARKAIRRKSNGLRTQSGIVGSLRGRFGHFGGQGPKLHGIQRSVYASCLRSCAGDKHDRRPVTRCDPRSESTEAATRPALRPVVSALRPAGRSDQAVLHRELPKRDDRCQPDDDVRGDCPSHGSTPPRCLSLLPRCTLGGPRRYSSRSFRPRYGASRQGSSSTLRRDAGHRGAAQPENETPSGSLMIRCSIEITIHGRFGSCSVVVKPYSGHERCSRMRQGGGSVRPIRKHLLPTKSLRREASPNGLVVVL